MSGRTVFISYRRSDSQWAASRLYDTLSQAFPDDKLFMDVDSIDPGQDFVSVLEEKIAECDVFLALIGASWLSETQEDGQRRIDDPEDFVRLEIAGALARSETVVIPVLLDGAEIPQEGDLPAPLKPLARRQFLRLTHEGYRSEVARLVAGIGRIPDKPPARQHVPPEGQPAPSPGGMRNLLTAVILLAGTGIVAVAGYRFMNQVADLSGRPDLSGFQECDVCPEMVVIPAGEFLMGSPEDEPNRRPQEGPQRKVQVERFAIARTELTFKAWDACVADGGCEARASEATGVARERIPAMDLSWADAEAYLAWLNTRIAGAPYRLPSEAEWEYAARAGTDTAYPWGTEPDRTHANMGREICCVGAAEGADEWVGVAPVGQFPSNGFGLHDMAGNLSEWTADVYRDSYEGAPADGSARPAAPGRSEFERRVLRGGSYKDRPWQVRSAQRFSNAPDWRLGIYGFRPARDLSTPE